MSIEINVSRQYRFHRGLLVIDDDDNSVIGDTCTSELDGAVIKFNIHNLSAGRTKRSSRSSSDGVREGEVANISKPNGATIDTRSSIIYSALTRQRVLVEVIVLLTVLPVVVFLIIVVPLVVLSAITAMLIIW